jgi:hypothetical protein
MEVKKMNRKRWLSRKKMMAAEIYGYSYDNYENHLGIGNIRYEKLMPDDVDTLERAEREGWDAPRLAQALDLPEERVASFQRSYQEAKEIVDAPTPAEAFRRGVRYSIQHAVEEGLEDKGSIERLATQIGYRTADLGFRLAMEGKQLLDYSEELRQETEYDTEYWDEIIRQRIEEIDQEESNEK